MYDKIHYKLKKINKKKKRKKKKRAETFADKGPYTQSYVLSLVMCGCVRWTRKKAEH